MKKTDKPSSSDWGGVRPNSGRPKATIVKAVRFDITCPYCNEGFAYDVLAVRGQYVFCHNCENISAIPKKCHVKESDSEMPAISASTIKQLKQAKLWEE